MGRRPQHECNQVVDFRPFHARLWLKPNHFTLFKHAAILILLLWASPVFAAIKYTAKTCTGGASPPNCSNANNGTSRQTAKLTVAAGVALLASGDTLIIGNGTYAEGFVADTIPSGSAGAPTILQAENRNQAILRYINLDGQGSTGEHHITLDGLYLDVNGVGVPFACTVFGYPDLGCDAIIFKNGTVANGGGGYSNGGMAGVFTNSEFLNNDLLNNGDSEPGQSSAIMGNHSMYMNGSGNLIDGNRITCASDAGGGIDYRGYTQGANTVIRNNVISGCALYGINLHSFVSGVAYNNTVRSGSNTSSDGVLAYCIVVQSGFAYQVKVYNNTCFGNSGGIGVRTGGAGTPDTVTIANNALYQTGTGINVSAGNNLTCTTNFNAGGNGVQSSCSATLGTTDPRFANSAGADFRLCTGAAAPHASCAGASGAIDVGTTLADVDVDVVGTSRPQGKAYDIGAYEASTSTPTRVSFATDNFTNASTALVSTYSAANWAIVYDNGSANGVYVDAATDVAYGTAALTDETGGPWVARRADTGTGWLNDQYASCQAVALPPGAAGYTNVIGVVVRASTDTDGNRDYLLAEMYGDGASGRCVSLQQFTNGVKSSLADDCGTSWTTSDFLEIDVIGNVVRVLKNGTAFITATTTLTTGFPGIAGAGNVGSIVAALDNCDFGGFDDPQPPSGDIIVSLPATGAVYQRPDPSVRIEWSTQSITGNVDLEYSLNGGTDYFAIATVGHNTSPYFWTANVPRSTTVVVRVKQGAESDVTGAFTVSGQYLR